MDNKALYDVLSKFKSDCQKKENEAKVPSNEALQKEADSRPPYIAKQKVKNEVIKTFDKAKNKKVICGKLVGTIYRRTVKKIHFMYKYHGYGMQLDVAQQLIDGGCTHVVLKKAETGEKLVSTLADWLKPSVPVEDLKHGPQRFLDIDLMTCHGKTDKLTIYIGS